MPEIQPVNLAILWHMHQPNYQEARTSRMVMPWVRLHATKDYLDMPLRAAAQKNVRVTFNLVPSLLDQIQLYIDGGTDPHLELSRVKAEELTESQRILMLSTFFSAHPKTMIEPHPRYNELFKKKRDNFSQSILPALFSSEEFRDLQVWSNLVWVDPMFRKDEPIKGLFEKKRHFTEEDKHRLLDWQLELLKRIIPTYRDLYQQGKIDLSFTPYYHPILPLLCDTDAALEALPRLTLPKNRFAHPEDAEKQIRMAATLFEKLFGRNLEGMWPSEGSVSESAARIIADSGIRWIATDEEILFNSVRKSGLPTGEYSLHAVYEFGPGLRILFRDHALSDRVGFVYSGMPADRAVEDFLTHVKNIRKYRERQLDRTVIPVILDGENAWEYFDDDGHLFLTRLYEALDNEPLVKTVTMSEAAALSAQKLPSLFAGSWINHNFKIWIGHAEDNAAWDMLSATRNRLVEFERSKPGFSKDKLEAAWRQVYIAEGSDWCWWYGDEHRGEYNEEFDKIYRKHLVAVYEILGLDIPIELLNPIFQHGSVNRAVMPDQIVTPVIDGRLTHFYEWTGAGHYDNLLSGGAMHRVERFIKTMHFAYDHERFYIRLDFVAKKNLEFAQRLTCRVSLFNDSARHFDCPLAKATTAVNDSGECLFAFERIFEFAIARGTILENGTGSFAFRVSLFEEDKLLENCPEDEPIKLDLPEKNRELFWPS